MMRAKDDYRSLNGLQKAALLVMSVGEDTAAKLFQLMHDDEIREISQTMAHLGTVNATVIERLICSVYVAFASPLLVSIRIPACRPGSYCVRTRRVVSRLRRASQFRSR